VQVEATDDGMIQFHVGHVVPKKDEDATFKGESKFTLTDEAALDLAEQIPTVVANVRSNATQAIPDDRTGVAPPPEEEK